MSKYDFFVAGRWRNRDAIAEVVQQLRGIGKNVYCFVENEYEGDGIKFEANAEADPEKMIATTESLKDWQTNPTFRQIFQTDMDALRDSEALMLVFPAGLVAHIEIGVAYGMGKKVYGVGSPEKPETLYLVFDKIFSNNETMAKELA